MCCKQATIRSVAAISGALPDFGKFLKKLSSLNRTECLHLSRDASSRTSPLYLLHVLDQGIKEVDSD